MEFKFILSALFISCVFVSANAGEYNKSIPNKVMFVGQIVNPPCELSIEGNNAVINLGEFKESDLSKVGSKSKSIPFQLEVSNCNKDAANLFNISLMNYNNPEHPLLLGIVNKDSENSARNIGVEILDHTSKQLTADGKTYAAPLMLSDNQNVVNFSARYVATGPVKTGNVVSIAMIQIEHQ